jgi:hypothetical protein
VRAIAANDDARALVADDDEWLAPAISWAPARGSRRALTASGAAVGPATYSGVGTGTSGGIPVIDTVLEGVADTVIDDVEDGEVAHTVIRLANTGGVVEVDRAGFGGPGAPKLQGVPVKWAVQRVPPKGALGLLTRASVQEAVTRCVWEGGGVSGGCLLSACQD